MQRKHVTETPSPQTNLRATDSFGRDLIERELVSIVLRMSRHLQAVDTPAAKKLDAGALDYLRRKGLMPSPLRTDETIVQSAPSPQPNVAGMIVALRGLLSIISDSDGVSGYEPGRATPWDEFPEVEAARLTLSTMDLEEPHTDDLAVDRFAAAMKSKLAKKRDEGRGGWEDRDDCSQIFLSHLLREHVEKGDPVDVGNLAMMLHQREERISSLLETLQGE